MRKSSKITFEFILFLLRDKWHIMLCKFKVYNLWFGIFVYCHMITTRVLANTSIACDCFVCVCVCVCVCGEDN